MLLSCVSVSVYFSVSLYLASLSLFTFLSRFDLALSRSILRPCLCLLFRLALSRVSVSVYFSVVRISRLRIPRWGQRARWRR